VREVEQRLLTEVVRGADRELVRLGKPEPVADEAELTAGGQRRRHQNRRRTGAPEELRQGAADVDRSPGEQVGLGPDDAIAIVGLQAGLDVGGEAQRPCRDRVHLVPLPGQSGGELREPYAQCLAGLGRNLPEPPSPPGGRDDAEEAEPRRLHPVDGAGRDRHGGLAAGTVDVPQQAVDHRPADPAAEPGRCRLLQPVRLVEDHRVVLGEDGRRVGAAAQSQVREVERMVRDHELGMRGALARSLGEARPGEGTEAAEAAVGADCDLRPHAVGRLDVELRPVARLGRLDPPPHRVEGGGVLGAREELSAEELVAVQAVAAEIVLAALEDGHADVAPERGRRHRHVLREELLLERLGRGRDDDAPAGFERRDQVGEALTCPRAGLGEQMLLEREGALDGDCERGLLGPRLVAGQSLLESPARAEESVHA
jgi:hypothetical protein